LCPHGRPLSCSVRHEADAIVLGDPLCAECFDYVGAVLWNAHVPRLWERTSLRLYLEVGRTAQMTDRQVRSALRLSYIKVVEFQRRGLVHLHVVIRADGRDGPGQLPPAWLDAEVLTRAVEGAVASADVAIPAVPGAPTRARWGTQYDVRVLVPRDDGDSTAIAAYVAKYATKTADGTAWLAHPIRSASQLERLELRPHVVTLVRTAWALERHKELSHLRLRTHAHTLGYTGQFSSKSQRFSTTFTALRRARALFVQGEPDYAGDYDGEWRYAGRGYSHPEADGLASSLLEAARGVPRPSQISSQAP
jgi:hypothetical protein